MAPKPKITKELIIEASFSILKKDGFNKISVREISKKLNCSTQPIFTYFNSINEVKDEIIKKSLNLYYSYINEALKKEKPYLHTGLAYITLAKDEPEIFKLLFMSSYNFQSFNNYDDTLEDVYKTIALSKNISIKKAKKIHQYMWLFAHGIATMVATKFMSFNQEEITLLLSNQYYALLKDDKK